MAKRARMKGVDKYVATYTTRGNAFGTGWFFRDTRRGADVWAKELRAEGYSRIKIWICRVPVSVANDSTRTTNFIRDNYPHCVGED